MIRANIKKSIVRQHLHILFIMIGALTLFYATLFVINRIQYINDKNAISEKEIMLSITNTANIAESINIRQVRYFIDYVKLLEFAYKNGSVDSFLKQNTTYDFIGIANQNGKFIHANNLKFAQVLDFEPYEAKGSIRSTIFYSNKMLTTYRTLSYPLLRNGAIYGYIVAYLDLAALIDIRGLYLISKDSYILNDNYLNGIYLGNKNLSFLYPEAWVQMQLNDAGQFRTDDGIFTYKAIFPETKIEDYTIETNKMYFLSFQPIDKNDSPYHINSIQSFVKYTNFKDRRFYWILGYMFILFTCVVSYIIIIGRIKNNLIANTDQLTGAYNRRKGLAIIDSMIANYHIASKNAFSRFLAKFILFKKLPTTLHICIIDIDNLKSTNDKLGHKFGDELISTTIKTIRRHLRRGDIIVRIGGDEFLIAFANHKMANIEAIWERITEDFERKNKSGKYRYEIRVSKGVIEYQKGMNIESCIIEADKLMYQEKKGHKINLFFD